MYILHPKGLYLYLLCVVETKSHLDHSEQALIGGWVSRDGETSSGVSSDDAVHSTPGWGVRLVFICHSQVSNDHIHPVLMNLTEELTDKKTDLLKRCSIF